MGSNWEGGHRALFSSEKPWKDTMNGSRFDQTCKEGADSAGLPLFPEQQDPSYPPTTTGWLSKLPTTRCHSITLYWPSSSLKAVTAAAILTPATTVPPSFCPSPKVFVPSCVLFPLPWIGSSFPGLFGGLRIFEAHIMYCERLHPFQTTVTITKIYSFLAF